MHERQISLQVYYIKIVRGCWLLLAPCHHAVENVQEDTMPGIPQKSLDLGVSFSRGWILPVGMATWMFGATI